MEKASNQILRLVGTIVGLTAGIALIVLLMGYFMQWEKPVQYSNGFFWAGAILIVIGILSVAGGFVQRANFNMVYAESAGQANLAERAQRTVTEVTQRYGTLTMLVASGILLIAISVAIGETLV